VAAYDARGARALENATMLRADAIATMLVAACVLAGCSGGDEASPSAIGRDSANIKIVDNTAPSWREGEAWTVSAEPTLDIGSVDGNPDYEFGGAHGPVRLSDGRIVVADMQSNYMSFFDASGKFIMRTGGSGGGPGEFEQLYRLRKITGDSLMALEPATLTSIYSPDGRYVRRFDLDPVDKFGNIWWLGRLDGGVLLAFSLQREGTRVRELRPNAGPNEEAGLEIPEKAAFYRDSLMHFLYDMEGNLIDSIGRMPSQWLGERTRILSPNAAYAFTGDAFHHSPGNITDIRTFRLVPAGAVAGETPRPRLQLERIVRQTPQTDLTVTDEVKKHFIDAERARYERMSADMGRKWDEPMFQQAIDRMQFPASMPAHGNRMYPDADGNLWLQDYQFDPDAAFGWNVFDPDGRWLGTVTTPPKFVVNEIGKDYLLGVWRDSLDVQHIRMYGLNKPAADRR
jgi:hypothetical protein